MQEIITSLSPMMQHYEQIKAKYEDAILFYRLGDFYEMFNSDAKTASEALDLTLTRKKCGGGREVPMCGVPYHAADGYIAKLISFGYKVAVCEQLTEPQKGKKIVERDVVRVITPGTVTDDSMLEERSNNYIACIYKNKDKVGLVYADITTGEFKINSFGSNIISGLTDALVRISPAEVIGNQETKAFYESLPIYSVGAIPKMSVFYDWAFTADRVENNLQNQFGKNYKKVFELEDEKDNLMAAGALLEYLNETQKRSLSNLNKIQKVRNSEFMVIDTSTRRNLELAETIRDRKRYGSLLWLLDKTKTSMGARLFRKVIDEPLVSSAEINSRLDAVSELVKNIIMRDELSESLRKVNDIERLSGKISYGSVNPRDLLALKYSLANVPEIRKILSGAKDKRLTQSCEQLIDFRDVVDLLERAIDVDAPALTKDGRYIKAGFNAELDEYRNAGRDGKGWLAELEAKEREATGIKNLKVGYNRVFGYFIEINRSQIANVPTWYVRKQTVANNERYITSDLKEIEDKILGSEENSIKIEAKLFERIKEYLLEYVKKFQSVAKVIADVDVLLSLAAVAVKNGYVRPTINDKVKIIKIEDGRHPVVEAFLKGESFISNDTSLDQEDNRTMVITGPNMAGKSTYMRQVAVITYLAHIGSFVPAKSAEIAITDRIFTRVGASDDLAFGQSTFMVEMSEVAAILKNATDKSLIVLDEIGRGTSTFDGLSIAWAVMEYLSKNLCAKTLFATHYHELTELEGILKGVKNYKVSVKESDGDVVFLHKIVRGGANKSFGIEVASLAGVPKEVIKRAKEISVGLERVNTNLNLNLGGDEAAEKSKFDKVAGDVVRVLKDIDVNRLSPMTAFELVTDLVKKVKGD